MPSWEAGFEARDRPTLSEEGVIIDPSIAFSEAEHVT